MMDGSLTKRIVDASNAGATDASAKIAQALVEASGRVLTVRRAREAFTKVLDRARKGEIQVIGSSPGKIVVVISVEDLVGLTREAALPASLGEVLDAVGFSPTGEHRLGVRRGRPRNKLRTPGA